MKRQRDFGILRAALVPIVGLLLCHDALAAGAKKHSRKAPSHQESLTVSASAYNSTTEQTTTHPFLGAWGDRLDQIKPGFRAIAVSPDLVSKGLTRNKRVRIQGFKGEFLVLDRTPPQWQNTIDIYMGSDVEAAKRFGRKQLKIYWTMPGPPVHKADPAGRTD